MLKQISAVVLGLAISASALAEKTRAFDTTTCTLAGGFATELGKMFMKPGEVVDVKNAVEALNRGALKVYVTEGDNVSQETINHALASGWLVKNVDTFNYAQEVYLVKKGYPLNPSIELVANALKGLCYQQLAESYEAKLKGK